MGFTSNPTGYTTINASDVPEYDEEDKLNSDVRACNMLIESIDNPVITLPKANNTCVPLTVPHLFWRASCSPINDLPLTFNCLLNVGSHLVIIREDLINQLKLRCKKLDKPVFAETAMHNGRKNVIEFDKIVKLQLYDASGHYISKSICAVISASLCVPILLGLPFLKHNNIIIDVEANTAIDKNNGFNLLNPVIPEKPKPKFQKLKFNSEFHTNMLKLCAQLSEELKTTEWQQVPNND